MIVKKSVYINGRVVPEEKARVSVFDRGLNYGDGFFETMKAESGAVGHLRDHLLRLKKGSLLLGFPPGSLKPLELDIRDGAISRLLKANGLLNSTAYLKITVTRGVDAGGHLPKKSTPTVIIVARPVDTEAVSVLRANGVKATLIKGFSPAIPGVKTLNYLPNVLGKIEAEKKGATEGIFVEKDGKLSEGTSSNIFVVTGGVIKTPPLSKDPAKGVLPGVMRKSVIRLLRRTGFAVKETPVFAADLLTSSEAFLTNSIWGAVPLVRLEGKKIGSGKPGEITRLIQDAL